MRERNFAAVRSLCLARRLAFHDEFARQAVHASPVIRAYPAYPLYTHT
jgi:hypothetical protein